MTMQRKDAAVSAWLAAIADYGWQGVTLDQAAHVSGLSRADIASHAGDRTAAVAAFLSAVQRDSAAAAAGEGSPRDRLFDGVMRGFDALQAHRAAVLRLWKSRDPGVLALVIGQSGAGLRRLASAAGCAAGGVRGQLRLAALAAICARVFDVWRTDESPDMAATMAMLDQLLAKAEQAETEGVSLGLIGLSGLSNPFGRARRSSPGPQAELGRKAPPRIR